MKEEEKQEIERGSEGRGKIEDDGGREEVVKERRKADVRKGEREVREGEKGK